MPEITRFQGMVIKMYFQQREHNPPHFHVLHAEYMGAFEIESLEMCEGDLPEKLQKLIREWAKEYQKELLNILNTQDFVKLPPLN